MSSRDDRLATLALSLADGTPVDWAAAESSAASDSERRQIRDLQLVGQIVSTDDATAPSDPPQDEWGPLRIIAPIGRGRFGDVYRAWDPRLDREVALKLLRRRESDDPGVGRGVIEEGRLLARVRHPNVVTVYGAERIDGRVGVWMELVSGGTLEEALANGPLPPDESAAIGADVARALGAVHAAGLLHRDVKAQNVMRDEHGRVVLMDFGTGQDLTPAARPELAGTPLYLAPEALNSAAATPQSDIYSVGVLVFHLLTGTFPITGRTVGEVRAAHQRGDGRLARAHLRDQPPDLVAIIDRALAASPEARFATAAELAEAFDAFKQARRAAIGDTSKSTTGPRALAVLGVIGAAVIAAVVWGQPSVWRATPSDAANTSPRVICDDCGMLGPPSISSDGSRMAFVDASTRDVAVRDLTSRTVTQLHVHDPSAPDGGIPALPVISRDGRQVAFAWVTAAGESELRITSTAGDRGLRRLVAAPDVEAAPLAWSADGLSVLAQVVRSNGVADLSWVAVADGTITAILRPDDSQELKTGSPSPDGRWIAYGSVIQPRAGRPAPTSRPLVVMPSTGGAPRRVTASDGLEGHPLWSADGKHLVFQSDVSGTSDIWSAAIVNGAPAGAPVLVRRDIGASVPLALTPTGQVFFYEHQDGVAESLIAPLAAPPAVASTPSLRLVGSNPAWSPDGRSIAVVRRSTTSGTARAVVVRTLATGEEHVYRHEGLGGEVPVWFGNSEGLLVRIIEGTGEFWYRLDVDDGRFVKLMANRGNPSFFTHKDLRALAPDGKTLYFAVYASQTPGSRLNRIVAADLGTGVYRDVLTLPGSASRWPESASDLALATSPDGRMLAIQTVEPETRQSWIWAVGVDGQGLRQMCGPFPTEKAGVQWTRDGGFLLFTAADAHADPKAGPSFRVMRLPVAGGTPEFTGFTTGRWMHNFDVSPDGTQIVSYDAPTTGARDGVWATDLPAPWRVR